MSTLRTWKSIFFLLIKKFVNDYFTTIMQMLIVERRKFAHMATTIVEE